MTAFRAVKLYFSRLSSLRVRWRVVRSENSPSSAFTTWDLRVQSCPAISETWLIYFNFLYGNLKDIFSSSLWMLYPGLHFWTRAVNSSLNWLSVPVLASELTSNSGSFPGVLVRQGCQSITTRTYQRHLQLELAFFVQCFHAQKFVRTQLVHCVWMTACMYLIINNCPKESGFDGRFSLTPDIGL